MKKWSLLFALLALPVVTLAAWYWTNDLNISNNSKIDDVTLNNFRSVAVPLFALYPKYFVWQRHNSSPSYDDLIFKKTTSSSKWSPEVNLTNGLRHLAPDHDFTFSIATEPDFNYVYIPYIEDNSQLQCRLWLYRSSNAGQTWENFELPNIQCNRENYQPAIAAADNNPASDRSLVFVVWKGWDNPPGYTNPHINVAWNTYHGMVDYWSTSNYFQRINDNDNPCTLPSVAITPSGTYLHVTWLEQASPPPMPYQIKYRRYNIAANQWSNIITISDPSSLLAGAGASIDCSKADYGNVYIVWHTNQANPNGDVYYSRSTNNGDSFSSPVCLSDNPSTPSLFPSISAGAGSNVVDLSFQKQVLVNSQLYTHCFWRRSWDGGGSWGLITDLSSGTSYNTGYGSTATDVNDCLDMCFGSYRPPSNNAEIYYKRYYCNPCSPTSSMVLAGVEDFNPHNELKSYNPGAPVVHITPNPMKDEVRIGFALTAKVADGLNAKIYDTQGRLINSLVLDRSNSREAFTAWDGKDASGRQVRNGVYFVTVQGSGIKEIGRLVLAR